MHYTIGHIGKIIGTTKLQSSDPKSKISELYIDSRTIRNPNGLFFALPGNFKDGHEFIMEAYAKGVRNFIVSKTQEYDTLKSANILLVDNCLEALQKLASYHRRQFPDLQVIGITGSNGKTVVKEWLNILLHGQFNITKSPKSYNSQIGVPLSVWQINETHNLGIFEAGISRMDEMDKLENIIRPNIGVLTNIGPAHDLGFETRQIKIKEKLSLFNNADAVICNSDTFNLLDDKTDNKYKVWGTGEAANLFKIESQEQTASLTHLELIVLPHGNKLDLTLPFSDDASVENALNCLAVCLQLNCDIESILPMFKSLTALPMRLEMKAGVDNSLLINDAYSADLSSLKIALEYLDQQKGKRRPLVILSDFVETGGNSSALYGEIKDLLSSHKIDDVFTVGTYSESIHRKSGKENHFTNTDELIAHLSSVSLRDRAILIKGAREFRFENLFNKLSNRGHSAVLEIDLEAMDHNLSVYSSYLRNDTKIMAVVKASAYGSGSAEMANFLSYRRVNYLAVAFADEGADLRTSGIQLPIIVLNPDSTSIPQLIKYNLEPEVYDFQQLRDICNHLKYNKGKILSIHIKLDTGMHRLGFLDSDIEALIQVLNEHKESLHVASIFSHLSSSEDDEDDNYTNQQFEKYERRYEAIAEGIHYRPMRHILNTAGIIRFPEKQFDMVRLGLGLYGIDTSERVNKLLQKAHTLKAQVLQVKSISEGSFIGYNRRMKALQNMKIAIVNIGYADGLMRLSGNQNHSFLVNEIPCPIIGNVNMDLTIIDISNAGTVVRGDDVIIFGKNHPIENLAKACQTIPYEILSRIAPRIKRIYTRG